MNVRSLNNKNRRSIADAIFNSPRGVGVCWIVLVVSCLLGKAIYSTESTTRTRNTIRMKHVHTIKPKSTVIGNTELFYKFPNGICKGILIFFHGCNHGGQDAFYLPEDRLVLKAALERGLAVVSISSTNRKSGCWSKTEDLADLGKVFDIWLKKVHLLKSLPRIGMGASSGGGILFSAYKILKFKALASYIMWKSYSKDDLQHPDTLPATAFVYMGRDKRSHILPTFSEALLKKGVASKVWQVEPHPLTVELCTQRIPELGEERCHGILETARLNHADLIGEDYTILEPYNKGYGAWYSFFNEESHLEQKRSKKKKKTERGKLSDVSFDGHSWLWASMVEEIAVSYGMHEMTADYRHEVLDWLMVEAGIDLD